MALSWSLYIYIYIYTLSSWRTLIGTCHGTMGLADSKIMCNEDGLEWMGDHCAETSYLRSRLFKSTALMMLATAASKTSARNGNRPQPNNLEEVFNITLQMLNFPLADKI